MEIRSPCQGQITIPLCQWYMIMVNGICQLYMSEEHNNIIIKLFLPLFPVALLASCDAFRLGSSQRIIPLSPPVARLFQDEGAAQPHFIQELVRTKRHSVQELVRAQPHLVHDMGWPEIHETSRSQGKMDSANFSQLNPPSSASQDVARTRDALDENQDVEDEMEVRIS